MDVSDMLIRKDRLLSSMKITFQLEMSDKRKKDQYLDSLLIDDRSQLKGQNSIVVEFWNSPVNYKGYKMSKSKLILFGLQPISDILIKQIESVVYMKYGAKIYKLIITDDFMPFQIISSDALINKIK